MVEASAQRIPKDGDETDDQDDEAPTTVVDGQACKERVANWVQQFDPRRVQAMTPWEGDMIDSDNRDDISNLDIAKLQLVLRSASFARLTAEVKSRLLLDYPGSQSVSIIQAAVSQAVTQNRGVRALQPHEVEIQVDWDPLGFIREQNYTGACSLLTALVINGSSSICQLLPCLEYVMQVWPSIGESVIRTIVKLCTRDETSAGEKRGLGLLGGVTGTLLCNGSLRLLPLVFSTGGTRDNTC